MLRILHSKILRITMLVAITAGLLLLGYAYFIEPNRLVVKTDTLDIDGWDPAFDGLKIVMIGDIHGGSNAVTEERIRDIVATANAQDADIVVLLGDYVAQYPRWAFWAENSVRMPAETVFKNLAGIKARYGVYAVLGNHDGWYGNDRIAELIRRQG